MMTSSGKLRLSQLSLVSQVVGEGGGGEGGSGEGEDDAVARSTGSHCAGQAQERQYSLVGQVLQPAELTTLAEERSYAQRGAPSARHAVHILSTQTYLGHHRQP